MKAVTLAVRLASRLTDVLPVGFSATAQGDEVRITARGGFSAGAWVGIVDLQPRDPSSYESAAWSVLSAAQDVVSEATTMPWPRAAGAKLDLALPASRVDDSVLHLWYGAEDNPALRLVPIHLADTPQVDSRLQPGRRRPRHRRDGVSATRNVD